MGAILDVRVALFEELDDDSALREEEEARPLLAGVIVGRGERVDFGTEKDRSRRAYQLLRPRRHVLAQGLFGEVRVRRIGQNDEERRGLLRCGRKRQRQSRLRRGLDVEEEPDQGCRDNQRNGRGEPMRQAFRSDDKLERHAAACRGSSDKRVQYCSQFTPGQETSAHRRSTAERRGITSCSR